MKKHIFPKGAFIAIVFSLVLHDLVAQFTNIGGSGWWSTTTAANGIGIGNLTTTPFTGNAAFQVRGDLMPTTTGEVFRTDAPTGVATSWRLFRNGTQLGRLYAGTVNNNFHVDATNGNLIFRTNDVRRAMIMQATTGANINSYGGIPRIWRKS